MKSPEPDADPARRPLAAWAIAGLVAVVYVATLLWFSPIDVALLAVAAQMLMALPGVLLVRVVAGPERGWLPAIAFGPMIGIAASSLVLLGLWAAGARGLWLLLASPAVVCALLPLARRMAGRWDLPATHARDAIALTLLLLIVPLVVARPFSRVGAQLHAGQAYRAYFTADYVWRRAVVIELAKGDVLPVNPFYTGDSLHYYWLPHLASAVEYRTLADADRLDALLLDQSVLIDLFFIAFAYGLARLLVSGPIAAALGVATVVLLSSYEGTYSLYEHWAISAPYGLVKGLNIDAVTRWRFEAMPIDGLHRLLLYQPHHAEGYAMGLLGLIAVARRARAVDPAAMAVGGTLLGMSLLTSSFGGLMCTAAAALYEGVSCLRRPNVWRIVSHAAAAALPLALAAALVTVLEYVDTHGQGDILRFGVNRVSVHNFLPATALSFGPMLILGAVGFWSAWRQRIAPALMLVSLLVVCVVFYFLVDIRDHQDVYVGWRVGHLTFIACCALCGLAFAWAARVPRPARTAAITLIAAALVPAGPMTAIDLYNTQDVYNWGDGPGFPWTLILVPEEQEAFKWIQANTPPDAVFQVDALQRDVATWAYIPAFAGRRLGVGLPISMVPLFKYEQGARRAAWLFETGDAGNAHALARRNGIQYLLVGSPERKRHPGVLARFDAVPDLLPLVFRNREISIYRVSP